MLIPKSPSLKNRSIIKLWLAQQLRQVEQNDLASLDTSIIEMYRVVSRDPYLAQLSRDMFSQVPSAYINDPSGRPQIHDFEMMLRLLDRVIKSGPEWYYLPNDQDAMQMVGSPINAILDWPMGTLAGYVFFMNPQVNQQFRGILNTWGKYLTEPRSTECLSQKNGWLSDDALQNLALVGNNGGKTDLSFQQLFDCDPSHRTFGFKSWDEFFTRRFRPGVRPVHFPDNEWTASNRITNKRNISKWIDKKWATNDPDPTLAIVNACESTPLSFATNVKLQDVFWLKKQPYSLVDMLDKHPLAKKFAGGSVYQAHLSALSYHRWHAPVSGTVISIQNVAGTYYSENLAEGFADPDGPDATAANSSQRYLSAVATRGIIFIQADNPIIGLMAVIFIGMAEVSSCEFIVTEGDHITKGEEVGMFHYGGSSYCLLFRPSTNLQADNFINPPPFTGIKSNQEVCSTLVIANSPVPLRKVESCTLM